MLAFRAFFGKLPRLKIRFISRRGVFAIVAGLLLAASFPNLGIAGFAWIAPALFILIAMGLPGRKAFRIGWIAGFAHYLASLYWLLLIPVPLSWKWAPALGWVALSAFLALYPATWVWLCWKIFPARPGEGVNLHDWAGQYLAVPWTGRIAWVLSCAALWVAMEMTIARFLGGFPWNLLGDSQYQLVPLIQIASYTGVYGVSFVVVWTSLSLFSSAMVIIRRPAMRSSWIGEIILPFATVGALYMTGYVKLVRPERRTPELSVALVQPSIPQSNIWDEKENDRRFEALLDLSRRALTNKPDVLIGPEGAVPGLIRADEKYARPILDLARSNNVWIVLCADDFEPRPNATNENEFFNASFLISSQGRAAGIYHKRKLVMFGEYVPFYRALPFLKYLTPITGGFTPGERPVSFDLKDLDVKVSVLICFEDVFPHVVREYVNDDTDFLVNLTNNGWFGEGAAQWQHAAAAIFRAVENGVPLVRCSNNGLTCWIDSYGRLKQVFRDGSQRIYGEGFMIAKVPTLHHGEKLESTFYRKYGDVFGWGCVVIALFRVCFAPRRASSNGKSSTAQ